MVFSAGETTATPPLYSPLYNELSERRLAALGIFTLLVEAPFAVFFFCPGTIPLEAALFIACVKPQRVHVLDRMQEALQRRARDDGVVSPQE